MIIKLKVNTDYKITVKRSGVVSWHTIELDGYGSGGGRLRTKEKIHFRA